MQYITKMFAKFIVNYPNNTFEELSHNVHFEDITNGRKGAVLVDCKNNLIPIVRTTTAYNVPAQQFLPEHYDLVEKIKNVSQINNLELNNALVEIYDSKYTSMKYHSDQALDLAENSYICIFSCYDNPVDIRKLIIQNKQTNKCSEILLEHNSVVIFSFETNYKHLHKIILEKSITNNKWLGLTFRLSKTFINFINEIPYFHLNGILLKIADENEKKAFYKYRGEENRNIGYTYPDIDYTISPSDILPINIKKNEI